MANTDKASKLRKQRLLMLQQHLNKARMDISIHKLTTYGDVFRVLGVDEKELSLKGRGPDSINVNDFNNLIAHPLEERLRQRLANEAMGIVDIAKVDFAKGKDETVVQVVNPKQLAEDNAAAQLVTSIPQGAKIVEPDIHPVDAAGWWLPDTPDKICTLFKHQTKASKDLANILILQNKRAALLRAGVGVGKTFMYFDFISQLWQHDWFKGKSFSPWPCLIVTKASIVEQTRRVGVDLFGLDPFRQFKVLNYDGLRATAGSNMIEDVTIVQDGIAYKKWRWYPGIHPLVFILDECQSAKNEDSQQSQIVQSVAAIDDPNVKVIASSATPFTRVSEAKYFVINAGIEYTII